MTEEYFKYMDKLKLREAEARMQREQMYSQMHDAYDNLKMDNAQQQRQIVELREKLQKSEQKRYLILQDNKRLKETIHRKQTELNEALAHIAENESYNQSNFPYVVIEHHLDESEEHKKKEKNLEDKIKELQEKLGKKTVSLSILADGLMEYAEEAGIGEAHELFNHLNNLLISVPAWTDNVPELKNFFKKARKEMESRSIALTFNKHNYEGGAQHNDHSKHLSMNCDDDTERTLE